VIVGIAAFVVLTTVLVFSLRGAGGDEAGSPVERCVERFLAKPHAGGISDDVLASYVQGAYCDPFARRGWVYSDGSFQLARLHEVGHVGVRGGLAQRREQNGALSG